jgi:hypothetical protein
MVFANYGLFGALQGHTPPGPGTILVLGLNLGLAALAAYVGVAAFGGAGLVAVAVWTAWLAFAPWREVLATDVRPGLALAGGAVGVALVVRRREVAAGAALGLLGVLVPPALGTIPALACLGRWRGALVGLLAAAGVALLGASFFPGALPNPATDLGPALWGTPQLQNAALGAFHARLFLGPESLAAETPPPHSLPALALTLGALGTGAWLSLRALWPARVADAETAATAVCLVATAGLLLAGTTPRSQLAPAMLALLPLAGRGFWAAGGASRPFLALAVAGYLLAGTSVPALATAAAPILSAWPTLASPPVLGLALATLLLALVIMPRGWRR